MRYKILQQINLYPKGNWEKALKLYDKNMINLLINIPDNTLNILKQNLSLKIQPLYASFINYTIINKFLIFIDVFRRLYDKKNNKLLKKKVYLKFCTENSFH